MLPRLIVQRPANPATGKSGNLVVFGKVTIEFQLAIGYGFRPAGIAFQQTQKPAVGSDSNGRDNLPKSQIVIVDDPWSFPSFQVFNDHKSSYVGAKWNILFLIQDDMGRLGLLDPELENSSEAIMNPRPRRGRN